MITQPQNNLCKFLQNKWRNLFRFEQDKTLSIIRLNYRWFPVVWLGILVWYSFSLSPATAALSMMLTGLLVISYLWVRHLARHITAERELKYSAFQRSYRSCVL